MMDIPFVSTTDDPFDMWYCLEYGKFPANDAAVVRSMRKSFNAAAADLAALRAENVKLREALQNIVNVNRGWGAESAANYAIDTARAALA